MRMLAILVGCASVGISHANASSINWYCFFNGRASDVPLDEPVERCDRVLNDFVTRWREIVTGTYRDPLQPDRQIRASLARVDVIGHDEDVGTPDAALLRSAARAAWVAKELIRLGIPADLITIHAYGSNRLLVPMQGVEPQNRRVELILR